MNQFRDITMISLIILAISLLIGQPGDMGLDGVAGWVVCGRRRDAGRGPAMDDHRFDGVGARVVHDAVEVLSDCQGQAGG